MVSEKKGNQPHSSKRDTSAVAKEAKKKQAKERKAKKAEVQSKKEKKATAKKSSKKQDDKDESSSDSDDSSDLDAAVLPPAADRKAQTRGVPKEALDVGGNSTNHLHNTHCCIDVFIDAAT